MSSHALTVVVPVRDEERRLPLLLDHLAGADATFAEAGFHVERLLIVDDGSTDATAAIASARAAEDSRVRVLRAVGGSGKGAAVRTGMLAASSPFALLTDVDLATPLAELAKLAEAVASGAAIAIGSRALPDSDIRVHQPRYRELAGKTFKLAVRVATGLPFHDTQCGFKLFRLGATRPLFERQRTNGFAFDVELLLEATALGLPVEEVPVRWSNDAQTKVRFGSASIGMALELARISFRHRGFRSRRDRRELARTFRS